MIDKLLEFRMRVHSGVEMDLYEAKVEKLLRKQFNTSDEGDEWKAEIDEEALAAEILDIEPPSFTISRVKINPEDIKMYLETFSLNAKYNNPMLPKLDSVSVILNSGQEFTFDISYDEFETKLNDYFSKKPTTRNRKKTTTI